MTRQAPNPLTYQSTYALTVGDIRLSLPDFLVYCGASLGGQPAMSLPENQELDQLRAVFLEAGLQGLQRAQRPFDWVQRGLQVGSNGPEVELYRGIASFARELLDDRCATNVFFMHKSPGMRLRIETTGPQRLALCEQVDQRLAGWQRDGLIESSIPGVYEPEAHLFGGQISMRSVHRLFTIDSLAWLDYHVHSRSTAHDAGPAWALSLVMLRTLFSHLGITDWEDLDVWDRVRRKTGRRLPAEARAQAGCSEAMEGIQDGWMHLAILRDELSPEVQAITQAFQDAARPIIETWRADYFSTRQAFIGPREAAAFLTIFHWNRAALSLTRQALLTEALADRARV